MGRYEALPEATRRDMESRFMWAASTGSHPDATVEGAVATIVDPVLQQLEGAVDALNTAYRQLSNINPGGGQDRWVREALDTLRTAVRGQ
jgi:hypothetical protein